MIIDNCGNKIDTLDFAGGLRNGDLQRIHSRSVSVAMVAEWAAKRRPGNAELQAWARKARAYEEDVRLAFYLHDPIAKERWVISARPMQWEAPKGGCASLHGHLMLLQSALIEHTGDIL